MAKYDGQPFFLIDCKLFPGSSGSVIISNFVSLGMSNNVSTFDWFEFLGIYPGEFIRERETIQFEEMTITRKENYFYR